MNMQTRMEKMSHELVENEKKIEKLKQLNRELQTEVTKVRHEMNDNNEENLRSKMDEKSMFESELGKLRNKAIRFETDFNSKSSQFDSLRLHSEEKLKQKHDEQLAANDKIFQLSSALENANQQCRSVEAKLVKRESQVQDMQSKYDELNSKYANEVDMQVKYKSVCSQLDQMTSNKTPLAEELKRLSHVENLKKLNQDLKKLNQVELQAQSARQSEASSSAEQLNEFEKVKQLEFCWSVT